MEGDSINACELTASITAITNWLANQLGQEQLELLGVSFTKLGDTLLTIPTQMSIFFEKISAPYIGTAHD